MIQMPGLLGTLFSFSIYCWFTNTQEKISLADLKADIDNAVSTPFATGLICIRHCLGFEELNLTLDAAFADIQSALLVLKRRLLLLI